MLPCPRRGAYFSSRGSTSLSSVCAWRKSAALSATALAISNTAGGAAVPFPPYGFLNGLFTEGIAQHLTAGNTIASFGLRLIKLLIRRRDDVVNFQAALRHHGTGAHTDRDTWRGFGARMGQGEVRNNCAQAVTDLQCTAHWRLW